MDSNTDSWLERFSTWGEFRDAVLQNGIREFGQSAESPSATAAV